MTPADIRLIMDMAREEYLRIPATSQLDGMNRPLSPGETMALAYVHAVTTWLNSKGALVRDHVSVEPAALQQADSAPETEDADWVGDSEKPE